MMNIREQLHKALVDNVPQVAGRVFPLTLPQDTTHAALVYRFIGNHDTTGITCTIPINTRYGVQIDCFSANYGESAAIMEAVKQVLRDEFLAFNLMSFEDYLNITLKYRQIVDGQLEMKPVYSILPPVNFLTALANANASGSQVSVILGGNGGVIDPTQWQVTVDGNIVSVVSMVGSNSNVYGITLPKWTITPTSVVTVSHLTAEGGVNAFTGKPVLNNVVMTMPPHIINGTNDIYNGVNLIVN